MKHSALSKVLTSLGHSSSEFPRVKQVPIIQSQQNSPPLLDELKKKAQNETLHSEKPQMSKKMVRRMVKPADANKAKTLF